MDYGCSLSLSTDREGMRYIISHLHLGKHGQVRRTDAAAAARALAAA
jgi:hypothetical protein